MKQSILYIHHQIILIHKPDYVDFLLKHSPFQREPKQLSISYFTHCFFYLIFTVFFPLLFSPLQPPSPRHSPQGCPCPWVRFTHFYFPFSHTTYPIHSRPFHILFFSSIFTDTTLCAEMPVSYFVLVKSYSFFSSQIKYHFLSEATRDFPRTVCHRSAVIQKSSVHTPLQDL